MSITKKMLSKKAENDAFMITSKKKIKYLISFVKDVKGFYGENIKALREQTEKKITKRQEELPCS